MTAENEPKQPEKKRPRKRAFKTAEEILNDPLNKKIMEYALRHPENTVAAIGRGVKLKREATQKRINKLIDLGALQRRVAVDLNAMGFRNRYRIDIKINPRGVKEGARKFSKEASKFKNLQKRLGREIMMLGNEHVIVEDVCVLLGDAADLSANVRTSGDQQIIFDFVTERLREIPGVENTWTCIEAWSMSRDRIETEQKNRRGPKNKKPRSKGKMPTQQESPVVKGGTS